MEKLPPLVTPTLSCYSRAHHPFLSPPPPSTALRQAPLSRPFRESWHFAHNPHRGRSPLLEGTEHALLCSTSGGHDNDDERMRTKRLEARLPFLSFSPTIPHAVSGDSQRLLGNRGGGADPHVTPEFLGAKGSRAGGLRGEESKSSSGVGVWGPMFPCRPFLWRSQAAAGEEAKDRKQRESKGSGGRKKQKRRGCFSPPPTPFPLEPMHGGRGRQAGCPPARSGCKDWNLGCCFPSLFFPTTTAKGALPAEKKKGNKCCKGPEGQHSHCVPEESDVSQSSL